MSVCYTTGPRDMFNIGFGELAVICIVLIIAVGPERLPSMMKTLGKTLRTLRQASRDIRASTGIDELMREDFDLYAPLKPTPPRRPAPMPAPAEPAALPASTEASATQDTPEPKPVSRDEPVEAAGTPSVVVAPPPQTVGLPDNELDEAAPAPPAPLPEAGEPNVPVAASVETLPRAPIVHSAPPAPPAPPAVPELPKEDVEENSPSASEPKQSGT